MHLAPHMYKIITVKANAKENHHCKMHLMPNMYKFTTVKANAQKCYLKMHLALNMYKIITLVANAKEIITLKYIWHQICTKSLC